MFCSKNLLPVDSCPQNSTTKVMLTNEDDVEEEGDSDSQTLLNSHSPSCWGKIKQLRPRYQILIVMIGLLMLSAIVTGIIVYCWPKKGKYSPGYV